MRLAAARDEQNLGYDDVYKNEASLQVICMAARHPRNAKAQAFPSPEKVRTEFTADEVASLLMSYMIVQRELGPIVSRMTNDEMESWIERLEAGGSAFPLALLSSEAKNDLVMYLVSQRSNSQTDTSSPGSQREDTSNETKAETSNE
jgi:hypothetical protein